MFVILASLSAIFDWKHQRVSEYLQDRSPSRRDQRASAIGDAPLSDPGWLCHRSTAPTGVSGGGETYWYLCHCLFVFSKCTTIYVQLNIINTLKI